MTPRGSLVVSVAVVALAAGVARAAPPSVGVTHATVKVRPADAVPSGTGASLDAARNEFEAYQVVVGGGDTGVTGVEAVASDLVGPGGARVQTTHIRLYVERLYSVGTPSNSEGATGPWPDALVPDVDPYFDEKRNAFPLDVPAGEVRVIWVDVFVPPGTAAGVYAGTLTVTGTGLSQTVVPVTLRVRGFDLPSTASLASAFGMGWEDACLAHRGGYAGCGDAGTEAFHVLYALVALDHRVSMETVVYDGPHTDDWTHFDDVYGGLLDGTHPLSRLAGAQLTTLRLMSNDPTEMGWWRAHFDARGWPQLFDYTCDEPPAGCSFGEIPGRAAPVQAAGIPTLVTTDIDAIMAGGLEGAIDIAVPIVQALHDKGGADRRGDYDAFLAQSGVKRLWTYQSCISHGCGNGCVGTTDTYFTGWPSYMIDASALQNRAMEWISFKERVSGELYFQTTMHLPTAWSADGVCDFSGQGDGTLFYPGTPAEIGGIEDVPVESIRLKMIREGMEDYEYLRLVSLLGDPGLAMTEAASLFPAPYLVTQTTPEMLYAARTRLANRIEELQASPPGVDAGVGAGDGGPMATGGGDGCGCRAGGRAGGTPATMGLALAAMLLLGSAHARRRLSMRRGALLARRGP